MKKLHAIFGTVSVLSIALGATLPAVAGEGAAAGAASYRLSGTQVTGSAVAGAVGKSNASAAAFNEGTCLNLCTSDLSATAHGSAGQLSTKTTVSQQETTGLQDFDLKNQANGIGAQPRFSSGAGNDQVKF